MKTYSIIPPSLEGILSDDYLYFEGIAKPSAYFTLRDGGEIKSLAVLDQYFNDMYNLFLRKLTVFAGSTALQEEESVKLQALLQELIKVKTLIENSAKTAIMGE